MKHCLYLVVLMSSTLALYAPEDPENPIQTAEQVIAIIKHDAPSLQKTLDPRKVQKNKLDAIDAYLKKLASEQESEAGTTRRRKESNQDSLSSLIVAAEKIRKEREQEAQTLTTSAKTQIIVGGIFTALGVVGTGFTLSSLTEDDRDDYHKWTAEMAGSLSSVGGGLWMMYQGWNNPGAQAELANAAQIELHLIQAFRKEQEKIASEKKIARQKKHKKKMLKDEIFSMEDMDE